MIGTKIYKENFSQEEYEKEANWANSNNAYISDEGEYYETKEIEEPTEEELNKQKVAEAHKYLEETDYVAIKIAEGVATKEDYAEILERREEARELIRSMENN